MAGKPNLKKEEILPLRRHGVRAANLADEPQERIRQAGRGFAKEPRLLLKPEFASRILVLCMVQGWFAGDKKGRHTLARHITLFASDFVSARGIINGTDNAALLGFMKGLDGPLAGRY